VLGLINAVSSVVWLARFFEATRRVCVLVERLLVVRFFARAAPARLAAVAVRGDFAAPRFDFAVDFLPARDFVLALVAIDYLRGGRIEIGKSPHDTENVKAQWLEESR
jgi:hypothetical protein